MRSLTILCLAGLAALACRAPEDSTAAAPGQEDTAAKEAPQMAVAPDIEKRLAQFSPTPLTADLSALAPEDRQVLDKLVEASRFMNEIFLRQAWLKNPELRQQLQTWNDGATRPARDYYEIMFGPWDRLDEKKPFIGDLKHPAGAGYYPEDMTKEELEKHLQANPGDKEAFTSNFTVIRRRDGKLVAVPYSQEYAQWLEPAAKLLREAAQITRNASLRRYLELRADAFASNDYYQSDFAWMDLDAPVEVTIGPYETYEDELFGYKAAFESFVTVNVPKESAALARYKERLPWLERNLPLPDQHKNLTRGAESPIRVVDSVYTAGDTRAGVQTIAFNLPNDERVREAKGSKKVLLRNTIRAKFDKILVPIAQRVLVPEQVKDVAVEAFMDEVLHHELSHGLGPGTITVGGRKTEVRLEAQGPLLDPGGGQGGRDGHLQHPRPDRAGRDAEGAAEDPGADLCGRPVPLRPLRRRRGPRPGRGGAVQLPDREGRPGSRPERPLSRRLREVPRRHPRPAARHADASGRRRLPGHETVPRQVRQGQPGPPGGHRPPRRRAGRHQAGLYDRVALTPQALSRAAPGPDLPERERGSLLP